MTTDRELLEMALEALEEVRDAKILALELKPSYHNIISSLHARLAEPREWQGLTDDDLSVCDEDGVLLARYWEAKLKERNT